MRVADRLVAALVALVLLAVSLLVLAEVLAALAGHAGGLLVDWPEGRDRLRGTAWHDAGPLAAGGVLVVAGLLLLALVLRRHRADGLVLRPLVPGLESRVRRPDLERALVGAARNVGGVSQVRVRLRRGAVTVDATSVGVDPAPVQQALSDELRARLAALRLAAPPQLRLRTRPASSVTARGTGAGAGVGVTGGPADHPGGTSERPASS